MSCDLNSSNGCFVNSLGFSKWTGGHPHADDSTAPFLISVLLVCFFLPYHNGEDFSGTWSVSKENGHPHISREIQGERTLFSDAPNGFCLGFCVAPVSRLKGSFLVLVCQDFQHREWLLNFVKWSSAFWWLKTIIWFTFVLSIIQLLLSAFWIWAACIPGIILTYSCDVILFLGDWIIFTPAG